VFEKFKDFFLKSEKTRPTDFVNIYENWILKFLLNCFPDGRVLIGVLGKVYDVTKGKRFYGPGNPNVNHGINQFKLRLNVNYNLNL
jgi:hypothetical protein